MLVPPDPPQQFPNIRGIVHVDFATQERMPKDSALAYARVIAGNGAVLAEDI